MSSSVTSSSSCSSLTAEALSASACCCCCVAASNDRLQSLIPLVPQGLFLRCCRPNDALCCLSCATDGSADLRHAWCAQAPAPVRRATAVSSDAAWCVLWTVDWHAARCSISSWHGHASRRLPDAARAILICGRSRGIKPQMNSALHWQTVVHPSVGHGVLHGAKFCLPVASAACTCEGGRTPHRTVGSGLAQSRKGNAAHSLLQMTYVVLYVFVVLMTTTLMQYKCWRMQTCTII